MPPPPHPTPHTHAFSPAPHTKPRHARRSSSQIVRPVTTAPALLATGRARRRRATDAAHATRRPFPALHCHCGRGGGGGRGRAHARRAAGSDGGPAVPGERDASGGAGAAVHAVGAVRGRPEAQHLPPRAARARVPVLLARRRQGPRGRRLHVRPGRRRLAPDHQPRPRRHQGQRRHIHGEGDDIVHARVHHPGGRRRGQDDRAVGRHRGHARRAEGPAAGHVRLGVVRRERPVLHRQEHHLQEHGAGAERGGDGEAGGGAAGVGGQRGVRGVPVPGRAGHALRPVGAPLLQGVLHRGVHRLHLRRRALPLRGVPRARDRAGLRGADGAEPAEHAGGHGVLVRQLQSDGVGGALPGPGLGHLLPRHLRLHLHGRHHRPARLVQLGRPQPRADGVLRAVQVHGPRRQLLRQGVVVAGAHRRGGQALHLPQLHRRHRVDQDLTEVAFHVTRTHVM